LRESVPGDHAAPAGELAAQRFGSMTQLGLGMGDHAPTPAAPPGRRKEPLVAGQDRLTLRNLYLYAICLITLVVSIFAAVQLVRGVVALAYPDPGFYGYYGPVEEGSGKPSEEEIARQEQVAEESQRRQAVLDLVGSATTLLIAGPVYLYHWRRVQAELPARGAPDLPGPAAA
jgi:hypothetical protein